MNDQISIRRVRPGDRDALVALYAALSPDSRYARFLGMTRGLDGEEARSFCTPDHIHDEGFVAVAETDQREEIVGHLCLEPAGDRRLELAVAVSDHFQRHGIGRRLMEAALAWAQSHGIEAILASAFADNFRVLRLLSSAPYPVHLSPADGGIVDVTIPLVPELLPAVSVVVPAHLRASDLRRARRNRHAPAFRGCSRVVWRGKRQPGRAVAGSASKGSS